jgi:hypothetical protein
MNNIRLLEFFNKCGIKCDNIADMKDTQIPRETLLNIELYNSVQEYISEFKQFLSSSSHTSLQSSAQQNQQWPLLNLVRQMLKSIGYKLEPKRLCDGYDDNNKKKYKRIFIIRKL